MPTTCSCCDTKARSSVNLRRGWPRLVSRAGRFPWVRRPSAWNTRYPWGDLFWHHPQRTGEQQSDGPPLMMARMDWIGVDGGGPILGGDFAPHRGKGGAWSWWPVPRRRISVRGVAIDKDDGCAETCFGGRRGYRTTRNPIDRGGALTCTLPASSG